MRFASEKILRVAWNVCSCIHVCSTNVRIDMSLQYIPQIIRFTDFGKRWKPLNLFQNQTAFFLHQYRVFAYFNVSYIYCKRLTNLVEYPFLSFSFSILLSLTSVLRSNNGGARVRHSEIKFVTLNIFAIGIHSPNLFRYSQ